MDNNNQCIGAKYLKMTNTMFAMFFLILALRYSSAQLIIKKWLSCLDS